MSKNFTILLVDDDEDDQEMFCEVVSDISKSIQCLSASNGQEALQSLQNGHLLPDFIFLDLNMPRMNGKQCLAHLKNNEKLAAIPVVIYPTSKMEADKEETRKLGADYFLTKPSSGKQLKKELELIFEKKYEAVALDNINAV